MFYLLLSSIILALLSQHCGVETIICILGAKVCIHHVFKVKTEVWVYLTARQPSKPHGQTNKEETEKNEKFEKNHKPL